MRHTDFAAAAAACLLACSLPVPASAQLRTQLYVSGLQSPVGFVQDPSDPAVQYIVQQFGRIRVIKDGSLRAIPFLDVSAAISAGGERGLLGLAFPPDYATSGRFYVNFTNLQGNTVIARFVRSAADPLQADPATRFDLRWPSGDRFIAQPYSNHNGGHLVFGPDGDLYIGMGDGGSGNDPQHRAQNPMTLLGKILRIDVSVADADPDGYAVPPDNPFVGGDPVAALGEIWAFGVRNPWHFSFDAPSLGGTGALVIGDVGQDAWEEVDYEPAGHGGRNYGWRNREGAHDNITAPAPAYLPLKDPVFEVPHPQFESITGGFVYRGSALGPSFTGRYFFADFITGKAWSIGLSIDAGGEATFVNRLDHTAQLAADNPLGNISAIGQDADGELYVVNYAAGTVLRIVGACSTSVVPAGPLRFTADGGPGSVNVLAGAGCGWTAKSPVPWITITGGTPGTGSGPLTFDVAAMTTAGRRARALVVAGHRVLVAQQGCRFTLSPTRAVVPLAGGAVTVDVSATGAGCSWTAASRVPWITVISGSSGTGSGQVSLSVAARAGARRRVGTVRIAGLVLVVVQRGP